MDNILEILGSIKQPVKNVISSSSFCGEFQLVRGVKFSMQEEF